MTTIGTKIMIGMAILLAAIAIYLPFLEGFAFTPAFALIQRFSITINLGSSPKTVQLILFVVPVLLIKGLLDYHKRYHIASLLKTPLAIIIGLLLTADVISLWTSSSKSLSISTLIVHLTNLSVFITASIWLRVVFDLLDKEKLQKAGIKLVQTFALALTIFTVANALVSVSQFVDCSGNETGCHVWASIDQFIPNRLLPVGHQVFSISPIVIRAVGFFGDVNFNGMVALLTLAISLTLLVLTEILKKGKGYAPLKEQRFILITVISSMISYVLTISRSAVFGFLGVGVAVIVLVFIPIIKKVRLDPSIIRRFTLWTSIAIGIVIVFFALGFAVPLNSSGVHSSVSAKIVQYVKTIVNPSEDSSANGHALLFQAAVKIGNQKPLLGMGMGTFTQQYNKIIEPGYGDVSPHSTYGLLYAEQGVVGVLLYGVAIIYLWYLSVIDLRSVVSNVISAWSAEKRLTRELLMSSLAKLFIALIAFGIPFFSLATATYYGFFLPMTWWWGSRRVVTQNV